MIMLLVFISRSLVMLKMVHKDSVKDLDFIGLQVQTRTSNGVFRGNRSRVERKTSVSQMVVFPQT